MIRKLQNLGRKWIRQVLFKCHSLQLIKPSDVQNMSQHLKISHRPIVHPNSLCCPSIVIQKKSHQNDCCSKLQIKNKYSVSSSCQQGIRLIHLVFMPYKRCPTFIKGIKDVPRKVFPERAYIKELSKPCRQFARCHSGFYIYSRTSVMIQCLEFSTHEYNDIALPTFEKSAIKGVSNPGGKLQNAVGEIEGIQLKTATEMLVIIPTIVFIPLRP